VIGFIRNSDGYFYADSDPGNEIFVMKIDGTGVRQLTDGLDFSLHGIADPGPHPDWSSDGSKIVFVMALEPSQGELWGYDTINDAYELFVMNTDGSEVHQLESQSGKMHHPAWSPDGTKIAFSINYQRRLGFRSIVVTDADGTDIQQITGTDRTSHWHDHSVPAWSPDGNRIAYVNENRSSFRADTFEIFVVNAAPKGYSNAIQLTDSEVDWAPAWSPDGTKIAFERWQDGNFEIFVMNADGTEVHQLTDGGKDSIRPVWSPDGTRIAFSHGNGNYQIFLMNADGTTVIDTGQRGGVSSWTP